MAIVKFSELEESSATELKLSDVMSLSMSKMDHCCGGAFISAAGLRDFLFDGDPSEKTQRQRLVRVLKHVCFSQPIGRRTAVFITTTRGGPGSVAYESLNRFLRKLGYKRAEWQSRHGNYPIYMWCLVKKPYEGEYKGID